MNDFAQTRHNARIIVLQRLFERYFHTEDIKTARDNEFSNELLAGIDEEELKYDKQLADKLLKGTISYVTKSDSVIAKLAPEWPINQINKTDLQILRMAIYEGFIEKLNPEKVVIDEAIQLAKEFGGQVSGRFVNGVLGNLLTNKDKFSIALTK